MSFMTFNYTKFQKQTILQENEINFVDPKIKKKIKGENPLGGLKIKANRTFIEKFHPSNSVQIETLEDQTNTFTLYRMIEEPVDISKYTIVIQGSWGFNPYKDARRLNMDEPVEKFIALLYSGGTNAHALSEILVESVVKIIKALAIDDVTNFTQDNGLKFKKISKNNLMDKLKAMKEAHAKKKKLEAKQKEKPRNLLEGVFIMTVNSFFLGFMIFSGY